MQPQYIHDNSVSPPAQSLLQYSVSPDTLWITQSNSTQTLVSLILIALNNSNQSVNCRYLIFGLPQGQATSSGAQSELSPPGSINPVPLTPQAAKLPASSDQQSSWNDPSYQTGGDPDYPDYYLYKTTPKTGGVLQPGQSLIFRIHNVQVVKSEGIPQLMIREMAGGNLVNGFLPIQILNDQQLQIVQGSFQAAPVDPINPGDNATLTWAIFNADHWKLYNTNTDALLYKGNQQSSDPIKPLENTTYELIAYADVAETNYVTSYAAAMVNKVRLTASINGQQSVTVDAQTPLQISWRTQLANKVRLHATDGTPDQVQDASSGSGTFGVTPTQDTTYYVSAYYEDATQSPPASSTPVRQELDVYVNTPRIKRFMVSAHVPCNGAPVTLTWEVQSASTCTIDQGGGTFKGVTALNGSTQITPAANQQTTYTLTASAGTHQTTASVTVKPSPTGFYIGVIDTALQYSGVDFGLVYQELFWMIDDYNVKLWNSLDGVNWLPVGLTAPWTRILQGGAAVFDDGSGPKMWLVGGRRWPSGGGDSTSLNEVWRCTDSTGSKWELVKPNSSIWSPRSSHQCVVFQNKLWVIGGSDSHGNLLNDVYSSVDGINWVCETQNAGWPARNYFNSAVFTPPPGGATAQIWICAGYDANGNLLNDAWYTSDGKNWTQWTNANMTHWSPRWNALFEATNNKLWMCSGTDDDQNPISDLWYITGPSDSWHPVSGCPTWVARAGAAQVPGATAYFDGRVWLFGTATGWGGNPYIWYYVPPYP